MSNKLKKTLAVMGNFICETGLFLIGWAQHTWWVALIAVVIVVAHTAMNEKLS